MDPQLFNDCTTNNEAEDPCIINLPPGYKFIPDDVDLVDYYLKYKLAGFLINPPRIKDVDVYKYPPHELEKYYKFKGEKEMYFFTRRSKKYEEGSRPNRDVKNHDGIHLGFWKATGKENPVMNNNIEVGFKRTLVYYGGKQDKPKQNNKGKEDKPKQEKSNESIKTNWKTNWIMQEYRIKDLTSSSSTSLNMDNWVLCKIYEHQYGMKKCQLEGQTNKQVAISTSVYIAPQCQLNQCHQTQCMQSSLSPNMIDNSQFQFNQQYYKQMQDVSSEFQMVSNQPNHQYSESQPAEVSVPSNTIGITHCQPNQYQYENTQQMQASSSSTMMVTPQYHFNQQHYSQDQQMQDSLKEDIVYDSHMPHHQAYQPCESQMKEYYFDPSQFI
ncbi:NAC domain-containing protein 2-like [Trifolium pratense]|uniref:NAC domain-containing protein 2-like n=1 Tax=Trifolium pratense TaxID=57577 RepID=UPI001E691BF2|nr:NAC domain-containing protein 2-like [Trifolium pratense]